MMSDGRVYDLDDFRNREKRVVEERLEAEDRPELVDISEETIKERLIEMGKEIILTARLAAELGGVVNQDLIRAATHIRNMTMRTIGQVSPDYANRAEAWATQEWMEATGRPLDPQRMSKDLEEQVRLIKAQKREGEK